MDSNLVEFGPRDPDAMAAWLKSTGRPVSCRLEFKLTSLEELKMAAYLVSELNKQLQQLAYEADCDPMLRVIVARGHLDSARQSLRTWNAERAAKTLARKASPKAKTSRRLPKKEASGN